MKKSLQFRYFLALGIVAAVMLLTFSFLVYQIGKNEQSAYVINVSGKQRMFSQRIAMFAHDVYSADTYEAAKIRAEAMQKVIADMQADHMMLRSGDFGDRGTLPFSPELRELYEGENGVNKWMGRYLKTADEFVKLLEDEGLVAMKGSDLISQLSQIARSDLLKVLDQVVGQYQIEAENQVASFKRWETLFVCFGLFILAIEARFIFRPMVATVIKKTAALERANAELTEFSYRISHDLRAPIVSSSGLIGMAEKAIETGKTDQAKTAMGHIKNSLNRLETLIEDVINLSRAKLVDIKKTEEFLEPMLAEILENLSSVPNFDRLTITREIKETGPLMVKGIYLRQTLENLISNSVKYQDAGKDESFVKISAEALGNECVISISDNGIGIPESAREKLFGMFERFHPKTSFGSGLGLYLVKQNVRELGGEIDYIPQDDGSEFRITFPST